MLYDAYEVQRSLLSGASRMAGLGAGWLNNPTNPFGYASMGPIVAAGLGVFAHASAPRGKPEFGLDEVLVGKKMVAKKATDGTEHQVEIDVTLADVSVLIGTAAYDVNIYKSGRNIEGVQIMPAAEFNAYTVLKQKRLVLTKAAFEFLRTNKATRRPEAAASK